MINKFMIFVVSLSLSLSHNLAASDRGSEKRDDSEDIEEVNVGDSDGSEVNDDSSHENVIRLPLAALLSQLVRQEDSEEEPRSKKRKTSPKYLEVIDYGSSSLSSPPNFIGVYPPDANFFMRNLQSSEVYASLKKEVESTVYPFLIFGPEGVGKATLAHDIAYKSKAVVYEVNLEMAPLKIQVDMVIPALEELDDIAADEERVNVLLLKGVSHNFPFADIFEISRFEELASKVFIVATSDVDLDDYAEMNAIEKNTAVFKSMLSFPGDQQRLAIIKKMVGSKNHNLSRVDFKNLADDSKRFNGHDFKTIINRASFAALREQRRVSYRDVCSSKKPRFSCKHNPEYMNMYL